MCEKKLISIKHMHLIVTQSSGRFFVPPGINNKHNAMHRHGIFLVKDGRSDSVAFVWGGRFFLEQP